MVRAVILAAGSGRRMGNIPKAILSIDDISFLERVSNTCRSGGCDSILVVTAEGMEEVAKLARSLQVEVCFNPDPELGMFSSVKTGIQYLLQQGVEETGLLIHAVDHPRVSPDTIRALIDAFPSRPPMTWLKPVYNNRGGHPILFDSSTARALMSITPEKKLRDAFTSIKLTPHPVVVDDPGVLANVNTPEDL